MHVSPIVLLLSDRPYFALLSYLILFFSFVGLEAKGATRCIPNYSCASGAGRFRYYDPAVAE